MFILVPVALLVGLLGRFILDRVIWSAADIQALNPEMEPTQQDRKYSLTGETKVVDGVTLYRIRAEKDFDTLYKKVKKGDLGGWIQSEQNLSQLGSSWVADEAIVMHNASVFDDAWVFEGAIVQDQAQVYGDALVYDNAIVKDMAQVCGDANIAGDWVIDGNAKVADERDTLLFLSEWKEAVEMERNHFNQLQSEYQIDAPDMDEREVER